MLVDVWMDGKGITGKDAEKALEAAHITVNKNTIPFESKQTVRCFWLAHRYPGRDDARHERNEMREIGRMIAAIVQEPQSEVVQNNVKRDVAQLTARFPLYAKRLKPRASESTA
jgi:glycine hydroxymethyltransferase